MSQKPSPYSPLHSFSTLAFQPITSAGLPGVQIDAELSRIAATANGTLDRLSEIQRDDGALRDGIVDFHSLGNDLISLIIALGTNPTEWFSGHDYKVGDLIVAPQTITRQTIANATISGPYNPNGDYLPAGVFSQKPSYIKGSNLLFWVPPTLSAPGYWSLSAAGGFTRKSLSDVTSPDLATNWLQSNGTPDALGFSVTATRKTTLGTFYCVKDHTSGEDFDVSYPGNWAMISSPRDAGDLVTNSFVGDGMQTVFALSVSPLDQSNTQVFVNGIYQQKSEYSVSGSTLTFDVAPANLAAIEVVSGIPVQKTLLTVSDATISTVKIQDYAVTEPKIADGAVSLRSMGEGAVSTLALVDGSITAAKIADGAITSLKLSPASVGASHIQYGSIDSNRLADNAVTALKLANGSVTSAKLAAGPLLLNGGTTPTSGKHVVTKEWLERASSVSTTMIDDRAVTNDKVANFTLEANKIAKSGKFPIQVRSTAKSGTQVIDDSGWVDITGLEIEFTRTHNTSKLRIQANVCVASNTTHPVALRIVRNTSGAGLGNEDGSRLRASSAGGADSSPTALSAVGIDFVEDPGSGDVYTYSVQARVPTGSAGYINRSITDPNSGSGYRTMSSLTITEISA